MTIDELFTFTDKDGNEYICKNKQITLIHKNENLSHRRRKIGSIYSVNKNGKELKIFLKKETPEGIYIRTNAWGIPYEIFVRVDGIHVITDYNGYHYKILTKDVDTKDKSILHFKSKGYEMRIYIPLQNFNITSPKMRGEKK